MFSFDMQNWSIQFPIWSAYACQPSGCHINYRHRECCQQIGSFPLQLGRYITPLRGTFFWLFLIDSLRIYHCTVRDYNISGHIFWYLTKLVPRTPFTVCFFLLWNFRSCKMTIESWYLMERCILSHKILDRCTISPTKIQAGMPSWLLFFLWDVFIIHLLNAQLHL